MDSQNKGKKLSLNKESILNLSDRSLEQAKGGIGTSFITTTTTILIKTRMFVCERTR